MNQKLKNAKNYQEQFNKILESHVSSNVSLAKEISDLLNISIDSAYRRLRNETDYTLNETSLILEYFKIPYETLNSQLDNIVSFKVNQLSNNLFSYQEYLNNMLSNLEKLTQVEGVHLIFGAEDIPVFYHFGFPKLMDFKIKYWLKSLMNISEYQREKYEQISLPEDMILTATKIYNTYNRINSTEIWSDETIISTVRQIKYYFDVGYFEKKESAIEILKQFEIMIKSIQKNCETGYKFNQNGSMTSTKLNFYVSDVAIGNNTILVKSDKVNVSFISYSSFNFMQTNNINFNHQNENWLNNIIAKSTLISEVSERQRNQFFKDVYKTINDLIVHIETQT
jgi:hypothetical protein